VSTDSQRPLDLAGDVSIPGDCLNRLLC
jgi:hypothetical protein